MIKTETNQPCPVELNRKEKALRLIDRVIEDCLDLGFTLEQLRALVTIHIREKEESFQKVRVLFIDCNEEQLHNFSREFRELVRVEIVPLLLDHFLNLEMANAALVREADLIVTTTTHRHDVQMMVKALGLPHEVVSVCAQPQTEILITLVRLAGQGPLGMVCLSDRFPAVVHRALAKVGIFNLKLDYTTTRDPEVLQAFVEAHVILLTFSERYAEVKAIAGDREVISYIHRLDHGSVNLVRRVIERVMGGPVKRGE